MLYHGFFADGFLSRDERDFHPLNPRLHPSSDHSVALLPPSVIHRHASAVVIARSVSLHVVRSVLILH